MSSLPASTKRIGSKATEKRWRHRFPHYKSMGAFCCHGNQRFDPICPKTLCSLSPTPVMLLIKFDQDWPTGFRDIQVWKCGRRRTTTTDGGPLVYYKLTLWAFGSGELKTWARSKQNPHNHECPTKTDDPAHPQFDQSSLCTFWKEFTQWRLRSAWASVQSDHFSLSA